MSISTREGTIPGARGSRSCLRVVPCLFLCWVSEGPEEARGVAHSLVGSVLTLEDFKRFLVHSPQKLKAAMAECAVQGLGLSIYSCTSVLTRSNNLIKHRPLHHRLTSRDAKYWRQWRAVASVPLGLGNALSTLVM